MGIKQYEKNGKMLWSIYLNLRSNIDPTVRVQKRVTGIESEKAAISEEKKLFKESVEELARLQLRGCTWETVIDRWQYQMKAHPTKRYAVTTIFDHVALLRNWTKSWLNRSASELNKGDGRELLRFIETQGKSSNFQKKVKNTVNVIFTWGIEERLIVGVSQSPVYGLEISKTHDEKLPEILTKDQIKALLYHAKRVEHPWYPVWAMACLTGMRSGELQALLWSDVDLDSAVPIIRVTKSYNARGRLFKGTKAGYWRNVPISSELSKLLTELRLSKGSREYVLPRFWEWEKGEQARILRTFCKGVGLPSIRFHTLRACFATQLLSDGIEPVRVMKVGGWKDYKTMMRYIRMAGVDERGATESLQFLPSESALMNHVVNLLDFKAEKNNP